VGVKYLQSTFAYVSPNLQGIRSCAIRTLSRTPIAIYRWLKFCHISIGNVNVVAWNRKYILENQRKVVCPFKSPDYKYQTFYLHRPRLYFHRHLNWICCWHGFVMSIVTGNAIWLTNRLRKWTGLKLWDRNVRNPSRTYRFLYHCTCFVYSSSPRMQKCYRGPAYENSRWRLRPEVVRPFVRNKTSVQFERLYLCFRGRPIKRTYTRQSHNITNIKEQKMPLVNRK